MTEEQGRGSENIGKDDSRILERRTTKYYKDRQHNTGSLQEDDKIRLKDGRTWQG
jgi:hypothetical protein